jgi:hypothetical protein
MKKYIIIALVAVSFIVTGCSTASKNSVKNIKIAESEILVEGAF